VTPRSSRMSSRRRLLFSFNLLTFNSIVHFILLSMSVLSNNTILCSMCVIFLKHGNHNKMLSIWYFAVTRFLSIFTARCYAARGVAEASCPPVCPSVCPAVPLRYGDQVGILITLRLFITTFPLSSDPNMTATPKGTPPNFSRNRSGVGKIVDFRHLSRRISETVQDRVKVVLTTNRDMYTRFRLVGLPKSVTLNDIWSWFKIIDSLNAAKWQNTA